MATDGIVPHPSVQSKILEMGMREGAWTKADFDELVGMYIDGKTNAQIAEALGRSTTTVAIKGSRLGLYSLTQDEHSNSQV